MMASLLGGMAQVTEGLSRKYKVLNSNSSTTKKRKKKVANGLGMIVNWRILL
jgi:hypothetical protein